MGKDTVVVFGSKDSEVVARRSSGESRTGKRRRGCARGVIPPRLVATDSLKPPDIKAKGVLELLANVEENMHMIGHDDIGVYLGLVEAPVGWYLFDLFGDHLSDRRKGDKGIVRIFG